MATRILRWKDARRTAASDLRMLAFCSANARNTRNQKAVAISRLLNGPIRQLAFFRLETEPYCVNCN